jgi:glycosyltransferase involved in cell wall biosynthesis
MFQKDVLIDVSRLVWRFWRGSLPTGVDRVCLAYVKHFGGRAQAVVQRRGRFVILDPDCSDELFSMFAGGRERFRSDLAHLSLRALPSIRGRPASGQALYLNVGHTGLDEQGLVRWVQNSGLRAVFLLHDLIPILHPEYCRPGEGARHQVRLQNVLACAEGIIGNSQATIDDIAAFALKDGRAPPPSLAAPIGGSQLDKGVAAKKLGRPYFVVVGTIEARKNHLLLLQVWRSLVAKHGAKGPQLVIIGQRGWEADQTFAMLDRALDLREHVIEMPNCDDDEMAALVAGARALLMPSFAEGFGLPVAEALQLGTPVIASDLPVFREFAGTLPVYLDPVDGVGWESKIMEFTDDSPERASRLQASKGYQAPGWEDHFKLVQDWLKTLP